MPVTYGKLLRFLEQKGISIYKLKADKVIGTATIDKIRKGEGHIDTRSIAALCKYLKCQPGDILAYEEDDGDQNSTNMILSVHKEQWTP